jgi:hypothetical protein
MSTDSASQEQPPHEPAAADDDESLFSSVPETVAPKSGLLPHIAEDLFKSPEVPDSSPNSASRRDYRYRDGAFYQSFRNKFSSIS